MTTEKRYEILEALPTYGPMYVPITGDGIPFYSEGFVVRFYKSDGTDWVANFKQGWTDLEGIIELEKSRNVLVLACGICYLMNPNDEKPKEVFGVGYSAIFRASKGRIVLQGQIDLTIIEPDGTHWDSERISWDGIEEVVVENNLVSGRAWKPMHEFDDWVEFKYDLDTKILTGGSYQSVEYKKKPWWKLW